MNISDFKTVVIKPQSTLIYERHTNREKNLYTSVSTNVNVTMRPNNCILEYIVNPDVRQSTTQTSFIGRFSMSFYIKHNCIVLLNSPPKVNEPYVIMWCLLILLRK